MARKAASSIPAPAKVIAADWFRHTAAEALFPVLMKYHPHLADAKIVALSGPLGNGDGCKVLGRARRLKTTEAAVIKALVTERPPDYVMELDTDKWDILDQKERLALLDHELCHMAGREVNDDGVLGPWLLRTHDLEEFLPVLQRHGPWRPALKDFVKVARQLDLPGIS